MLASFDFGSPDLASRHRVFTVQAFVFADLGEVLNLGGNPSGTGDASLASAGSGLKLMLGNGLVASVEAARSIGGSPPSQQGSTRFFFSLSWAM
jgi:hemolysin activation/secretion protein